MNQAFVFLFFVTFLCAPLKAAAARAAAGARTDAQNAQANPTINLRDLVPVPAWEKSEPGEPLSAQTRKHVANQLLERVLLETAHTQAPNAPVEKLDAWVKKSLLTRFSAYCPSFSARRLKNEIEVTVVFATKPFLDDLVRAGFVTNNSAALRVAVVVLDEQNGTLTAVTEPQQNKLTANPKSPTDFELSAAATASERVETYSQLLRAKLRPQQLQFDAQWSAFATTLLQTALPQGASWPQQALPLTLWNWNAETGLIFLFGVSRSGKQGILSRSDVIYVNQGHLKRSYWSRTLNDPTAQENVVNILQRTAAQTQRLLVSQFPEPTENELILAVDRKVSEKELGEIEKSLRSLAIGQDALLIPIDVSRTDIRYRIPLPRGRASAVLEKIKRDVPKVTARLAPGDGDVIHVRMN